MLTYEKVLEIFQDYLTRDREEEVVMTSRGYVRFQWAGKSDFCDDGRLVSTPEELFDLLLEDCQGFEEVCLTKGRRELTEEDIATAKERCLPYLERRKEAEEC